MADNQKKVFSNPAVDYYRYAAQMRGSLINSISEMERLMDKYIVKYFCTSIEKRNELMEIIVSTKHLTFEAKSDIIRCLLVKTGEMTQKKANQIYARLNEDIAAKRNIIAHCTLDENLPRSQSFINDPDKTIYFIKYYNSKTPIPFTRKDFQKLSSIILAVHNLFMKLSHPLRK